MERSTMSGRRTLADPNENLRRLQTTTPKTEEDQEDKKPAKKAVFLFGDIEWTTEHYDYGDRNCRRPAWPLRACR